MAQLDLEPVEEKKKLDLEAVETPTPSPVATPPTPTAKPSSLTDALNISGEPRTDKPGDVFRGAHLETVPLDVAKTLVQTPVIEGVKDIGRTGQMLSDVIFGGKSMSEAAKERFPESQEFVGVEKKPIRERATIGAGTLTNLLFGAEMGKGAFEAGKLLEDPRPVATEQAAKEVTDATQKGNIEENRVVEHPGDDARGTPAETGGGGGAVTEAPVAAQGEVVAGIRSNLPNLTDEQAHEIASITPAEANKKVGAAMDARDRLQIEGRTVGDPERLAAEDYASGLIWKASQAGKGATPTELFSAKEMPFSLRGEEPPAGVTSEGKARASAEAAAEQARAQPELSGMPEAERPTIAGKTRESAAERAMREEYQKETLEDFQQHMEGGGSELLEAVKSGGGVPALSSARKEFSGELQNIREAYKAPRKERIKYADLFKRDAPDLDELTQHLKSQGFDVETPADTLSLIENRIRTGKPVYGSEARGSALEEASMGGMGASRAGEIPEGRVTGMKNRIVDEERAKRGWLPLMEPARKAMGTTWDQAMQRVEAGEQSGENVGAKMVDDILNGRKKDTSEVDHGVLLHERIRVANERDMAAERVNHPNTSAEDRVEAQNAWAAAEDKLNQTELALHEAGTISGRALQIRQLMARDDFTFAGMERRARAAKGGEPLEPEESTKIQEMSDRITELEKQLADRQTHVQETGAQGAFDEALTGLKKRVSKEKAPVSLEEQRTRIHDAILDRAEDGDTLEDASGLIHRLALNFVRSGISEREPLIDAVHNIIGDIFGVTRGETRNAISGYGKFKQLDPEAAKGQLRQLKGEMQQIGKLEDMASGVAPKKTGIERRTPSDEERRLIREVNEMKKKGGFEVTDPAKQLKSALDAVKTRLTNQIRDLHNALTTREPIAGKKGGIRYDAEAEKLRTMRDALKSHYDEIFGKKGLTDEQRLNIAKGAAERSLKDWQGRLDDAQKGVFKRPDGKKLTSPEIDAIRAHREAVKAEVQALESLSPEVQKMREQVALATYKARVTQRIADIQEKIARGDFTREQRKPLPLDKEAMGLQAKAQKVRDEFEEGILRKQLEQRPGYAKAFDTFLKYRRGFVLAWPTIFAKLTSAAFLRLVSQPIEDVGIGSALRRLPGIRDIAGRSPIEGRTTVGTVARSTASAFTTGMKDAWQTMRTGKSDLDRLYGKKDVMPREWIDFFGTMHATFKSPIKRYGFELAMENQMAYGLKNGVDVTDPMIQTQMALRAYAHGERLIFLQNNRAVSAYNMALRRLEQPSKETGRPSFAGKVAATALQAPLPIVKVPTNIVAEMFEYTVGSGVGGGRAMGAIRRGVENLSPSEADSIMRQMKKGSLGGALLILGYTMRNNIGGFYRRGEKRGEDEPKAGEVKVSNKTLPSEVFHSAIAGPMMIGATIGRVMDTQIKGVPRGLGEGIIEGLLAPIEQVPFFTGPERTIQTLQAPSKTTAAGEMIGGVVTPGAVQYAARATDKTPEGEVVKRRPENFWQGLIENIPYARRNLPVKGSRSGGSSGRER